MEKYEMNKYKFESILIKKCASKFFRAEKLDGSNNLCDKNAK